MMFYRFVQFFLRLGCGKAAPDPRSQPVLLQFTINRGFSWDVLQEFYFSNSSNQVHLVSVQIPLEARTTKTCLRWWQPSDIGQFYSPWVIDKVCVTEYCNCCEFLGMYLIKMFFYYYCISYSTLYRINQHC